MLSQYRRVDEAPVPGSQEHHVVEHLVSGQGVFGVAAVVGPGPKLLDDPRAQAGGRVDEP
jgi:hypothetical protein